jgi:hypothetical protein
MAAFEQREGPLKCDQGRSPSARVRPKADTRSVSIE